MNDVNAVERERARAIAADYRRKGYEVIEAPSTEQLPDFLSGYQPDLIVRKGDEAIIVEVKTRSSLATYPQIRELAQMLEGEPGWTFELVAVSEGERLIAPEGARPFGREDILENTAEVERLIDAGFTKASFLMAWSALEAAVRMVTEEEGTLLGGLTPTHIVNQAVVNGVISRDDYDLLTDAMKYRNALVHGYKVTGFDPALVTALIGITKGLLQSA